MADDQIRYDILVQDALRGVMRKVLSEVSKTGLPGDHHFFITFLTGAPGVRVSTRLKERYPEQMTIVVQYQYWDMKVTESGFEIGLSFSDVPEKLEVPFSAVRGFYDPSVNFELEFDIQPVVLDVVEDVEQTVVLPPRDETIFEKVAKKSEAADESKSDDGKSADVVSLDAFRKK